MGSSCKESPGEAAGTTTSAPPSSAVEHPSPGGNPLGMPMPFYVVGDQGISGPTVLRSGTVVFTITNNDTRSHHFFFVQVPQDASGPAILARDVNGKGESWLPDLPPGRVLGTTPSQSSQQTETMRVPPIQPGWYALVDAAIDSNTGKPYAFEPRFLLRVQVLGTP